MSPALTPVVVSSAIFVLAVIQPSEIAASAAGVPLAHVEAGLRSHDLSLPWPEEGNRVAIDALADLLFAPTEDNAANLAAERLEGEVHVTGNSAIDLNDTLAVLAGFGLGEGDEGYDAFLDRVAGPQGAPWRTSAATGAAAGIDLQDALANLQSFGHTCA